LRPLAAGVTGLPVGLFLGFLGGLVQIGPWALAERCALASELVCVGDAVEDIVMPARSSLKLGASRSSC
jgi:hypothetical protein